MLVWMPILKGMCTLNELRTIYDLDDLFDMHEALAVQSILKRRAFKE